MVNYEKLISANPWWSQGTEFVYYDADISKARSTSPITFNRKSPVLSPGNIYIIKGPRRIGKTFWIKNKIESVITKKEFFKRDVFYFSFDEVKSETEFSRILHWFLEEQQHEGPTLLFLDEIQSVTNWQNTIKALYDGGALKNSAVLITGSIAYALEIDELIGRVKESNIFLMRPISFSQFIIDISSHNGPQPSMIKQFLNYNTTNTQLYELLQLLKSAKIDFNTGIKEWKKLVDAFTPHLPFLNRFLQLYLHTGGYPFLINGYIQPIPTEAKAFSIADMYSDLYLFSKNDAALLAAGRPRDPAKAAKVLEAVLGNIGKKVSQNKMARGVGMDVMTFASYMARLQSSFAFLSIQGVNAELVPMRINKTYFADIALHYAVAASQLSKNGYDLVAQKLETSEVGVIVEEIIVDHMCRTKESSITKQYPNYVKFMQLSLNKEIDVVYFDSNNAPIAIEVKYQNSIGTDDFKEVASIGRYILVTKDTPEFSSKTAQIPAAIFLALLPQSEIDM